MGDMGGGREAQLEDGRPRKKIKKVAMISEETMVPVDTVLLQDDLATSHEPRPTNPCHGRRARTPTEGVRTRLARQGPADPQPGCLPVRS